LSLNDLQTRPRKYGAALGAVAAFATTGLMASVLYGVSAAGPRAVATSTAIVMTITLAASLLPA
jgi:hypothetical protein